METKRGVPSVLPARSSLGVGRAAASESGCAPGLRGGVGRGKLGERLCFSVAAHRERRDEPGCWAWRQGHSAAREAQPNPRLQAARPGAQLLGGPSVAHHRAMHAVIAVVGARLKRSVGRTVGQQKAMGGGYGEE